MDIDVYTDGSGTVKDSPGGWGYVITVDGEKHHEGSGHVASGSNNDMELEAAIQGLAYALKYIKQNGLNHVISVTLCSDSQIVLGWASGTYRFKQQNKLAKYEQLKFLVKRLNIKTRWVRGHSGDEHNERCDKLANSARKQVPLKPFDKTNPTSDTKIGTKKDGIVCLWHGPVLKVIDLEKNIVEDYNREFHGKRGSMIEIREEKSR